MSVSFGDKERPKRWYGELGGLISSTPPDILASPASAETLTWYGRVGALLDEMGLLMQALDFRKAFNHRAGTQLASPEMQLEIMRTTMYLALGVAERSAPAETIGGFIPVGSPHDALLAIAPVFGQASRDILIVDPYMSQIVINNFALSAGEGVKLRLLSGDKKTNPDIEPALRAWRAQRPSRALEVRTADQRLLHDRLIIPDGTAYWLSQSFNMLAKRSPATLQKFDDQIGSAKAEFYESLWQDAETLLPS